MRDWWMSNPVGGDRPWRVLVALFFWRSLDLEGGTGLVAAVLAALRKQGHIVTLLLPTDAGKIPDDGATITYARRSRLGTVWSYLRRLREASRQVDGVLLLENNPSFHLLMSPFLARQTPTAVHLSSPTVGASILNLGLRRQVVSHWIAKSRWLASVLGRLLGFHFPLYVVSTAFQHDELLQFGCPPERIAILPFGIDPDTFQPPPTKVVRAGHLIVGYVGHFSPIKGVPDLVEAFNRLVECRPAVELHLAWSGKGADAKAVHRLVSECPRPERIKLFGRVDVAGFMREIDVIVLPFRSASIPHLPLVLLEAFAMGVPVITTRVGGLAEAVLDGETGFTVTPGSPEEIARTLERLCDDAELRTRMREGILAASPKRYSTDRFCEALMQLIREADRV